MVGFFVANTGVVADSLGLNPAGHSLTLELRKRLFSLTHCRTCNLSIACFKSINHTTLITKDRTRRSFVISGGSGWIRTSSGLSQQIYSLPRLSNSGARPNLFATCSCLWLATRSSGEVWCGQRESNPHFKLGRLAY